MRPWFRLALVATVVAIASSCKPKGEPEAKTTAPTREAGVDVELTPQALAAAHLTTVKVEASARGAAITAAGTLEFVPSKVARVGPIVDGRVLSVRVQPGDKVTAGAALCTLDSPPVGRARADYVQAVSRLMLAERELARERTLASEGATSQREVERADTARAVADFEARAAGERLRSYGVDPRPLSAQDAGIPMASSATGLSSPIAGTVMQVDARVGQSVHAADTLFVVGSIDALWLIVDVYERDLARVRLGDPVKVTVLSRPGRVFDGRVDYLSTVVDPERRVAHVRVGLPNADLALGPGMSATARILVQDPGPLAALDGGSAEGGAAPEPILVPREAVQAVDGQPFVFVERGAGRYELRAIERGKDYEGRVEVIRGLSAGETIVCGGSFILKSELLREQMGKND